MPQRFQHSFMPILDQEIHLVDASLEVDLEHLIHGSAVLSLHEAGERLICRFASDEFPTVGDLFERLRPPLPFSDFARSYWNPLECVKERSISHVKRMLRGRTSDGRAVQAQVLAVEFALDEGPVFKMEEIKSPLVHEIQFLMHEPTARLYAYADLLTLQISSESNVVEATASSNVHWYAITEFNLDRVLTGFPEKSEVETRSGVLWDRFTLFQEPITATLWQPHRNVNGSHKKQPFYLLEFCPTPGTELSDNALEDVLCALKLTFAVEMYRFMEWKNGSRQEWSCPAYVRKIILVPLVGQYQPDRYRMVVKLTMALLGRLDPEYRERFMTAVLLWAQINQDLSVDTLKDGIRACISFELSTMVWNYLHPTPIAPAPPLIDPTAFEMWQVQARRELFAIIKAHAKRDKDERKKLKQTLSARLEELNAPYKSIRITPIRKAIEEMRLPLFVGAQSAERQFQLWSDTRNALMHEGAYRTASGREQVERHCTLRQMSALALYRLIGYSGPITFAARNGDAEYEL